MKKLFSPPLAAAPQSCAGAPTPLNICRYKLLIAYDGTGFLGWQSQKGGGTVQDVIETALAKVFKRVVRLHGASRTDSGVHALGQVGHFDAFWSHATGKLKEAINSLLPESVRVRQVQRVDKKFHARFSAKGKRYAYQIKLGELTPFECRWVWGYKYPIDKRLLKSALAIFVGRHNFSAFAGTVNVEETPQKTLKSIKCSFKGNSVIVTLVGSGFLYKMARSIVGTSLEVARGKMSLGRVRELLKTCKRTHEVITAPSKGLRLEKVIY